MQCRVSNKPYDFFGTWYNDSYLLSGDLRWLAYLVSTSVVWLNRASQVSPFSSASVSPPSSTSSIASSPTSSPVSSLALSSTSF